MYVTQGGQRRDPRRIGNRGTGNRIGSVPVASMYVLYGFVTEELCVSCIEVRDDASGDELDPSLAS